MEKSRPASLIPRQTPSAGAPYANGVVEAPKAEATTARRVTAYNIATFEKREKALPPDACLDKAPRVKFYQFPDRVTFYCAKCRKDGISSDTLAFDASHGIMMCVRCLERVVRPRQFKPSRVIPFPSLLSWLNYKPAPVMTSVSEDILSRPAEAAAPSGARAATEMLGGARQTDAKALPATPMSINIIGSSSTNLMEEDPTTHPCLRVWGRCAHGETCFFRSAPRELCVAFLMGICQGTTPATTVKEAEAEAPQHTCTLFHQSIEGLPTGDPIPLPRRVGDLDNTESPIAQWIAKKRNSSNRVEWQLYHNGPLLELLNAYVPEVALPVVVEEKTTEEVVTMPAATNVKLNKSDIASALAFLKKK
jgi:hypothetical protein